MTYSPRPCDHCVRTTQATTAKLCGIAQQTDGVNIYSQAIGCFECMCGVLLYSYAFFPQLLASVWIILNLYGFSCWHDIFDVFYTGRPCPSPPPRCLCLTTVAHPAHTSRLLHSKERGLRPGRRTHTLWRSMSRWIAKYTRTCSRFGTPSYGAITKQKQLADSTHMYSTVFADHACCFDPQNPQGKHEEADALYARAIEIGETSLGPDHPDQTIRLCNRAGLLESQV